VSPVSGAVSDSAETEIGLAQLDADSQKAAAIAAAKARAEAGKSCSLDVRPSSPGLPKAPVKKRTTVLRPLTLQPMLT